MTVKQAITQNKMISAILTVIATGLLAWGIWVTDGVYKIHYGRTLIESRQQIADLKRDARLQAACEDIFELKATDVILTQELKRQSETINRNYEKIMDKLIDIQRQIKQ